MQTPWQRLSIGMVAIAFASLCVAAATMLLVALDPVSPPEWGLPADRTIAVVHGANATFADLLRQSIPDFSTTPTFSQRSTLALVETDAGTEWLLFDPSEEAPRGSSPAALALLEQPAAEPLGTSMPYIVLRDGSGESKTWLFTRSSLLASFVPSMSGTELPSHMSLSLRGSGVTISLFTPGERPAPLPLSPVLHTALRSPDLLIEAGNGAAFLRSLGVFAGADDTLAAKSLLSTMLRNRIGSELSPTHDILPLLDAPVRLEISSGESPAYLLQTSFDEERLPALIDRLHVLFRDAPVDITRKKIALDERWSMDIVGTSGDAASEDLQETNGWEIRTTQRGKNLAFSTAVRGENVILSDNPEALDRTVRGDTRTLPIPPGGFARERTSGGMADFAHLHELLAPMPNLPLRAVLPDKGTVLWTVERDELRTVITVRTLP